MVVFFFQAEDGIRDLVRSRGLGDVYKRQDDADEETLETPVSALEPDLPFVEPDARGLTQPLTALKGVGQKIAEKLHRLGPTTIWELLYLFPRRYDDYTLMKPISKLPVSYTHLRAHETVLDLVCRLLLEKKKK